MNDSLFSVRNGLQTDTELQICGMNTNLRNALWNVLLARLFGKLSCNSDGDITQEYHVFVSLQKQFFRLPMDELERHLASRREWYKDLFFTMEWWQIYDLFEFVARRMIPYDLQELERDLNETLARENAAYRLVAGALVPIPDDGARESIKNLLGQLRGYRDLEWIHASETSLKESIEALGLRPEPNLAVAAQKSLESITGLLAHLDGAQEADHISEPTWRGLRSPGLGFPEWMIQALTGAWQTEPADVEEAWAVLALSSAACRLVLMRSVAQGWLPKRELESPQAAIPDPWGERHLVRNR